MLKIKLGFLSIHCHADLLHVEFAYGMLSLKIKTLQCKAR